MKKGYVYILTNKPNGTLYIGVTSDLNRRLYQHRCGQIAGFSRRYNLKQLVYVEVFDQLEEARLRELRLKKWKRAWKIELIEHQNPTWQDLSRTL
ncbi:MAG: GIY-YIG nuclease family protein [Methylocystaceae bacterium]|nr:GIY-YIG nuclease family protein [Methylocystaceae bacterium]